jgi:nitrite reductase (NO-forming)
VAVVADPHADVARHPSPSEGRRTAESSGWADLWWALTSGVAVMALILAFIGLLLPARGDRADSAAGNASSGGAQRFEVELGDLYVKPNTLEVEAGRPVVLVVTNASTAMSHDLKLDGATGTELLAPGESQEVELDAVNDGAQAWCTVPGHKAAGMVLTFVVKDRASPTAPPGTTPPDGQGTAAAVIDPQATPAADWNPFDPTLEPAPGATEHNIELSATEVMKEVAPGVSQELWTFNNQVPAPVIRGKVGDLFTVTLRNDGKLGHSIDFHASRVAWDDEMRTIQPGESLVYQFRAEHAGIYMYHCGTAPTLHHIGNGMYGAIIIDPVDLAPVDHEFVFVQSEFYLGPDGEPGDLTKMEQDQWDAVVFNGYHNQFSHAPIRVEPGERIRAWVLDAGPSENASFHVVGTIFDTVYFEGRYELRPGPDHGGSQALALQPAQGGFVEFSLPEPGFYPIVTHKFSNVGKGASGLFQAGDVELPTGGGH